MFAFKRCISFEFHLGHSKSCFINRKASWALFQSKYFHQNTDFLNTIFQQALHQLVILRFLVVKVYYQSEFQLMLHQLVIMHFWLYTFPFGFYSSYFSASNFYNFSKNSITRNFSYSHVLLVVEILSNIFAILLNIWTGSFHIFF